MSRPPPLDFSRLPAPTPYQPPHPAERYLPSGIVKLLPTTCLANPDRHNDAPFTGSTEASTDRFHGGLGHGAFGSHGGFGSQGSMMGPPGMHHGFPGCNAAGHHRAQRAHEKDRGCHRSCDADLCDDEVKVDNRKHGGHLRTEDEVMVKGKHRSMIDANSMKRTNGGYVRV